MRKPVKNREVVKECNSLVTKLRSRLARDARKYANYREVYSYRLNGDYSDNLLLLDSATKEVHADIFRRWFDSFSSEDKQRWRGIEVVHIGVYNKVTFELKRDSSQRVIFKGE